MGPQPAGYIASDWLRRQVYRLAFADRHGLGVSHFVALVGLIGVASFGVLAWIDGDLQAASRLISQPKLAENTDGVEDVAEPTGVSMGLAFQNKRRQQKAQRQAEAEVPLPSTPAAGEPFTGQPIEDPCIVMTEGRCTRYAMDAFYDQLMAREAGTPNLVRISHFGDSVLADTFMTRPFRALMQNRFGDGGPGFVYFARYSKHYVRGVRGRGHVNHKAASDWRGNSVGHKPAKDGLHGFGGVSFQGWGKGLWVRFSTKDKGLGAKVSRFELHYLTQPNGAPLELRIDDNETGEVIPTAGAQKAPGYYQTTVPDGAHVFRVRIADAGRARAFGVIMERDTGLVYDNLGIVGASARGYSWMDPAHWQAQIRHRKPTLAILFVGSNEADWIRNSQKSIKRYEELMRQVIKPIRDARPDDMSCLVMAPLDNAVVKDGKVTSLAVIAGLAKAQRAAALKLGCAFWDSYAAMGGRGSAQRWRRKRYFDLDREHLTPKGGVKLAKDFYETLMAGFALYKGRAPSGAGQPIVR